MQPHPKPTVTVQITRHFAAPAEKVFDAWVDPHTARKWLFATPAGQMVKVEIDARPGGTFNFTDRRDGQDVEHLGVYEAVERPERLVFRFGVPKYTGTETTRVSIDITPKGAESDLRLTHDGVWADFEERTKAGWTMTLEGLAKALA